MKKLNFWVLSIFGSGPFAALIITAAAVAIFL